MSPRKTLQFAQEVSKFKGMDFNVTIFASAAPS
jgi:hypothetical protein